MRIHEILALIEELAPPSFAAAWDSCGLQVGDPDRACRGVLISVNASGAAIARAENLEANLLITHHPLLFRAPKRLDWRREPGRSVERLSRAGITCYAAHTNLDATACNHHLASLLDLPLDRPMQVEGTLPWFKLTVTVPAAAAADVQNALWEAGAGKIGSYDQASFACEGTGTFRPLEGARPALGSVDELYRGPEIKLEVVVPSKVRGAVLEALFRAHPFEVPAYDLVQLQNGGESYGLGLWGELAEPLTALELAARLRDRVAPRSLRLVGDGSRPLRRVGLCSGAGGDLLDQAERLGLEGFITGEVRYHTALEALERDIVILEAGHQATEEPVVDFLLAYLTSRLGSAVPVTGFTEPEPFEVLA